MSSKSSVDEIVGVHDRLVALEFRGNAVVAGLFETPASGVHLAREVVEVIPKRGLSGDHDRKCFWRGSYVPGREVSACAAEVLEMLGVDPGVVGDNLVTRGLDLSRLEQGQRVEVGEVLLERSIREHRPCATFKERTSEVAFEVASRGYRGALFVVLRGGKIRSGDRIALVE